jgi:hypothetical protein
MGDAKQKKIDKSLDMTFPASDPPASNRSTATEAPARPASRQAPLVSKEDFDRAAGRPARGRRRPGRQRRPGPKAEEPGEGN